MKEREDDNNGTSDTELYHAIDGVCVYTIRGRATKCTLEGGRRVANKGGAQEAQ